MGSTMTGLDELMASLAAHASERPARADAGDARPLALTDVEVHVDGGSGALVWGRPSPTGGDAILPRCGACRAAPVADDRSGCACRRVMRLAELLTSARIPGHTRGARLEDPVDRSWVAEHVASPHAPRGIVLAGPVGSGKSWRASAITRAVIEGRAAVSRELHVRWLSWAPWLDSMRGMVGDSSSARAYADALRVARDTPLLIIDDLGAERVTPYSGQLLDEVLTHRLEHTARTTIATTNLSPSRGALAEYLGARLMSRLQARCSLVVVRGADRRPRDQSWGA